MCSYLFETASIINLEGTRILTSTTRSYIYLDPYILE